MSFFDRVEKPGPAKMCEHCKTEHFMYCVNGVLWLCWGCYVKWCAGPGDSNV